jgi:DMSO/TMAO reductase YedYZ molybdopterin-dependent catalytic subunit/mono/diheme cytochrome c family protein
MPNNNKSRRDFLKTVGIGGGVSLLASCSTSVPVVDRPSVMLPDGLDPANFHVHNSKPLALETKRSTLASAVITPASLLFVRNNLPMPPHSILDDRSAWALEVSGVHASRVLTLASLKQLGRETTTAVLQCSGNGRAFFEHGASGSQWAVGAAGCVNWTGVRLSDVAAHLGGALATMKYVTATGGEVLPDGIDVSTAIVERSIPISKGLDDVLLAWEMNGQPIPITHGGPLRMVVPGYFGCNQIKYVKKIAFSEEQSTSKIQRSGYRYRPIGEKGNPDQPSMWRMPIKSWVNGPGADGEAVLAGQVHFHGVAFSGERGVQSVEVSMDEGETWHNAEIYGPDMGSNAWRTFQYSVTLEPGKYQVVSRATDTKGDVQSEHRAENERGYAYNAWSETRLDVQVVSSLPKNPSKTDVVPTSQDTPVLESKPAALSEAGTRGKTVFQEQADPACGVCHTLSDAGATGGIGPDLNQARLSTEVVANAVSNGVGVMPSFGNTLSKDEIADLATYVVEATR